MTGEFDYLLKPIRPDAPRDIMRNEPAAFWEGFSAQRKLRKGATLTSPPPTPPERGGGSPRVRIEIEIVNRQTPQPQQSVAYRLGRGVVMLLLIVGLLSLLGGCGLRVNDVDASVAGYKALPRYQAEIAYQKKLDAEQARRLALLHDPVYMAKRNAELDRQTAELLAYYAQHPEADPANNVINCENIPGNRFECSNYTRTVQIEGKW